MRQSHELLQEHAPNFACESGTSSSTSLQISTPITRISQKITSELIKFRVLQPNFIENPREVDRNLHGHGPNFACESGTPSSTSLPISTSITRVRQKFALRLSSSRTRTRAPSRKSGRTSAKSHVLAPFFLTRPYIDHTKTKRPPYQAGTTCYLEYL